MVAPGDADDTRRGWTEHRAAATLRHSMRIFLDFDGVLRRLSSPKARLDADCVRAFEAAVLPHADARVVIASTWRLIHELKDLRALFSPALAPRIEGATPDLPEVEEHARHAEVQAYLAKKGLHGTRWIAVDDDAEQYRPGAPLIHVDPLRGFDAGYAQALGAWLGDRT